jgi:short-subunit dehydrogenase
VRAVWLLTQRLLPLLRAPHGEIAFINSSVIQAPSEYASGYALTKSALKALADSLRAGLNADDVRVLTAFIGRTATPLQQRIASEP